MRFGNKLIKNQTKTLQLVFYSILINYINNIKSYVTDS